MKSKTAAKKPNVFVRMGRKCKEVFSELKKVTWPSFGKVIKATGVWERGAVDATDFPRQAYLMGKSV